MNTRAATSVVEGEDKRGWIAALLRVAGLGFLLVALAACAAAEVMNVAQTKVTSPAPSRVLVEASASPTTSGAADDERTADEAASALRSELVEQLAAAGIVAEAYALPGAVPADVILLRISIVEAKEGSSTGRFLLGFGFGRATLQAKASLERVEDAETRPIMSFSTASDSGRMPGLVMAGGGAVAAASIVPLALGATVRAIRSAAAPANDFGGTIGPTATAIVDQLKGYYAAVGWPWPHG
ncbi:DUF4410 domain-containing protein [Reyranella sp.]|uniref:DUF4410 domain-containing protein n=1 Tax=Reyranella sp. TaxID=1929291 RepID=UPI003BA8C3B8